MARPDLSQTLPGAGVYPGSNGFSSSLTTDMVRTLANSLKYLQDHAATLKFPGLNESFVVG